ncbi:DnaB-like helicase C-terminal domain-containing protein [Thermophilibacter mediterraneus]|uniref:DnaB-like helicase C-terminal domain-containing protein n=1 Tax=Thermophilibacter mediterraneus TaxID=1871031 RepID=UPI00320B233E
MGVDLVFEDQLLEGHEEQIRSNAPMARFSSLPCLNRLLGGVYPGLVTVIGAQPACGKTTLLGQMADDLARQGTPSIVVSAELPAFRVVEKSLVRCSNGAFSLSDVTRVANRDDGAYAAAKEEYALAIAPDVCVIDSPVTIPDLARVVGDCVHLRGRAPAVFVDYLQLIATSGVDASGDERIAILNCVRALGDLARTYAAPLYLLSSIARTSYDKLDVGLDVFGGSQGIEYGIDNALYLTVEGDTKAERQANLELALRPVRLRALKVRYGRVGSASLRFDAAHATFWEADRAHA